MIPYSLNPLGITTGGAEGFVEFRATWPAAYVKLSYVSESPLPIFQDNVLMEYLPVHGTYATSQSSFRISYSSTYRIGLSDGTLLYNPSGVTGGGSNLSQNSPVSLKMRGYSPISLQDLFWGASLLENVDIDEAELTKNCITGWRVFADCAKLVFTPSARYWWNNPNWTGDHRLVFRNCTLMPNYNEIPSSWGGGGA